MNPQERIALLRQAKGDPEALALVTHDLLLQPASEQLREAVLAASIPHWFSSPILTSISDSHELLSKESFEEITALSCIERNEKHHAFNVQKVLRIALRRRFRLQEPDRFREMSGRASDLFATDDLRDRIESAYHALWWDEERAGPIIQQLQRDLGGSNEIQLEYSSCFRECMTEDSTSPWVVTWGTWVDTKSQREYLSLEERLALAAKCLSNSELTKSEYAMASAAELMADTIAERRLTGDREEASDLYTKAQEAYSKCNAELIPKQLLQSHLREVSEKLTALNTLPVDNSRFEFNATLQSPPSNSAISPISTRSQAHRSLRIFVSAVTSEFAKTRTELVDALSSPVMWVDTQEKFLAFGDRVLIELDNYIRESDAVIHIVGTQTGAIASKANLNAIIARYPDLTSRLGVDLEFLQTLSYTQWEAWLAVLHGNRTKLYIACPAKLEVASESTRVGEIQKPSLQSRHLAKLREAGYHPSAKLAFSNPDKLIIEIQRVLPTLIQVDELRDSVTRMNRRFTYVSTFDLINGEAIARSEADEIIRALHSDDCSGVLLVAAAGYGKSCILNQVLTALQEKIPIAAFKLDSVAECTTADRLGRELELPGSPIAVLSQLANGQHCVLMIDQLDAISTVSGRKTGTWEALAEMLAEARIVPGLKLILACRDFDLNQDHRLRQLSGDGSRFRKQVVSKLTNETVAASLEKAGLQEFKPTPTQLQILSLPFHLLLFLQGDPNREFNRISDLFDAYWDRKLSQTRESLRREPRWNDVIDVLTNYMSENQCLIAPIIKVEDFASDANVMASVHVLVRERSSYRFFHESFFDYAYARRFCSRGQSLLTFLSTDDQQLFRRAQVRQILAFRREKDVQGYLRDLREVLASNEIRFHIKRMMASEMHRISDPTVAEWEEIFPYAFDTWLSNYVWGALRGHLGWFDLLDGLGVWGKWLASDKHLNAVLWILQDLEIQKLRSKRIATLLKPYLDHDEKWDDRLKQFFSWGMAYLSEDMANAFLAFVARGVYDNGEKQSGDRDFWGTLYEASEKRPIFVIDALSVWFVYTVKKYDDGTSWNFLDRCVSNKSYQGCQLLDKAASTESQYYLQSMLPLVVETCINTQAKQLDRVVNRAWPWLTNNDDPFDINDAILILLRRALEKQALDDPEGFLQNVEPLQAFEHETISYLLLCGYSSNPHTFANQCIQYMISHKQRLFIGYGSWSGGGHGESAISRMAIQAVSPFCDDRLILALEDAVIEYVDEYEKSTTGRRGFGELMVLKSIDARRRSRRADVRISELSCSFPGVDSEIPPIRESAILTAVSSPIAPEHAVRMSDEQWISAMRKYDGSTDRFYGGPHELSRTLREFTRKNRARFANLAMIMPTEIIPEYFDAILDGLTSKYLTVPANEKQQDDDEISKLDTNVLLNLVSRMHELAGRPCGTAIVHCIGRISDRVLPDEVLETVSYYAVHDPDPDEDIWQRPDGNWYGKDPFAHGINCVRGQAAMTISELLSSDPSRLSKLRNALEALIQDKIISVRACAICAITPLLNSSRDDAVRMFLDCCKDAEQLWETHPFQQFIHFAAHSHYSALAGVIESALSQGNPKAVENVATQVILADLSDVDTLGAAGKVRAGTDAMRTAAANVYAVNVGNTVVGDRCAEYLQQYIDDPCSEVRDRVARAFWHVDGNRLLQVEPLILKFIESKSFEADPDALLHSLEESKAELPHVVYRAAERILEFVGEEGSSIANRAASSAHSVSKLVVRLYAQTRDPKLKLGCLDLIDRMEQVGYMGITDELAKIDR